jgi:hypothetical protein
MIFGVLKWRKRGMSKTNKVQHVAVHVPKNEMKLLEHQQFFSKDRDTWFTEAIHEVIISALDKLALKDPKLVRTLEGKYGLDEPGLA